MIGQADIPMDWYTWIHVLEAIPNGGLERIIWIRFLIWARVRYPGWTRDESQDKQNKQRRLNGHTQECPGCFLLDVSSQREFQSSTEPMRFPMVSAMFSTTQFSTYHRAMTDPGSFLLVPLGERLWNSGETPVNGGPGKCLHRVA